MSFALSLACRISFSISPRSLVTKIKLLFFAWKEEIYWQVSDSIQTEGFEFYVQLRSVPMSSTPVEKTFRRNTVSCVCVGWLEAEVVFISELSIRSNGWHSNVPSRLQVKCLLESSAWGSLQLVINRKCLPSLPLSWTFVSCLLICHEWLRLECPTILYLAKNKL